MTRGIDAVRLKNMLGDIQPNDANFQHGRLPQVVINTSTVAQQGRRGASTPSPLADISLRVTMRTGPRN